MQDTTCHKALFLLLFMGLWPLAGCAPEFTGSQCSSDANCFSDEQCGTAGLCVPRASMQAFSITSFAASEATIDRDEADITLSWQIEGTSLRDTRLVDQEGSAITLAAPRSKSGSVTLTLSKTTTFTLTATSTQGQEDTKTLTVTRLFAPAIASFIATPTTLTQGASSTLSWETKDVRALEIVPEGGEALDLTGKDVAKDTVVVRPAQTTTYSLRAVGRDESMLRQELQVVVEQPYLLSVALQATRTMVKEGDSLTLSWTATGASELILNASDGTAYDLSGKDLETDTLLVTPKDPMTTYTLRATGASAPVESSVTVTVEPLEAEIVSFMASPDALTTGDSTTLTYQTKDVDTLAIKAVGTTTGTERELTLSAPVDAGMISDTPTESTLYTLTASNPSATLMRTVTVSVFPQPDVVSLTASPMALVTGDSTTLAWEVGPFASVMLSARRGAQTTMVAITTDRTTGMGSVVVEPQEDTEYTLIVTSGAGRVAMASVLVSVTAVPLQITEIMRNPSLGPDMHQWVEVYNPTDRLVPLSAYTIAGGQTLLTQTTLPLTGLALEPRGCLLLGGPIGLPMGVSYALATDFAPDLPTADGIIALLYGQNNTLVDTIVFGQATFPGEDGALVDTERTPVEPADTPLIRTSDSDVFSLTQLASPGRCFEVFDFFPALNPPKNLPNESTDPVTFGAYGFDARTMTVSLGANVLPNCTETTPGQIGCDGNYIGLVGPQDFVVTKDREIVLDATGMVTVQPVAGTPAASDPVSITLSAREADTSADFFCGIVDSGALTLTPGSPATASLRILSTGDTDGPGADIPASWRVEMALIPPNALPYVSLPLLDWVPAIKSGAMAPAVVYEASLTSATARTGELAFRIKRDVDHSYVYCDREGPTTQGSDNGWNTGGGLPVTWAP